MVFCRRELMFSAAFQHLSLTSDCGDGLVDEDMSPFAQLEILTLGSRLTSLPDLSPLTSLHTLYLHDNQLTKDDVEGIARLPALTTLSLTNNLLTEVPDLSAFPALTTVRMGRNPFACPVDMDSYTRVQNNDYASAACGVDFVYVCGRAWEVHTWYLSLIMCRPRDLTPGVLDTFTSVTHLAGDNARLTSIPDLSKLTNLTSLNLNINQLTSISGLGALTNLTSLGLNHNRLVSLDGLSELVNLRFLSVEHNELTSLPDLSFLTQLERIMVSDNKLASFPILSPTSTIAHVNAQFNLLTEVPQVFSQLPTLDTLELRGNPFHCPMADYSGWAGANDHDPALCAAPSAAGPLQEVLCI